MIAFGPVPSRRLGCSLGINHIQPKHCTYSCVYCQVGRTRIPEITRQEFFPIDQIIQAVEKKIYESTLIGQKIDYLTLVPDGEPTLDIHLGELINRLSNFNLPVAVISNASLLNRREVQTALLGTDWVSVKIDSVVDTDWKAINRPHNRLSLSSILAGIHEFRKRYQGELVTETMLVSGINDHEDGIYRLAAYLKELQPNKSYVSIPTRPPAETWVTCPKPDTLQKVLQILSESIASLDVLFEAEADDFISTGDLVMDILGITAVHPIREEALRRIIEQAEARWEVVDELVKSNQLVCIAYRNENFYQRKF